MTTVLVKLESIQSQLSEIKAEFRNEINNIKSNTQKNSGDIIRIDESLKSAWNAINKMQDKKEEK